MRAVACDVLLVDRLGSLPRRPRSGWCTTVRGSTAFFFLFGSVLLGLSANGWICVCFRACFSKRLAGKLWPGKALRRLYSTGMSYVHASGKPRIYRRAEGNDFRWLISSKSRMDSVSARSALLKAVLPFVLGNRNSFRDLLQREPS